MLFTRKKGFVRHVCGGCGHVFMLSVGDGWSVRPCASGGGAFPARSAVYCEVPECPKCRGGRLVVSAEDYEDMPLHK